MGSLTIRARLIGTLGLLLVLLVAISVLGLQGMSRSNAGLETVYKDRTVPLVGLANVDKARDDALRDWRLAALHDAELAGKVAHDQSHPVSQHVTSADENEQLGTKLWGEYMQTYLTEEEKILAAAYASERDTLKSQFAEARAMAQAGRYRELDALLEGTIAPTNANAATAMGKLLELQTKVAAQEFEDAHERYGTTRALAIAMLVIAIGLGSVSGMLLMRAILVPLAEAGELAGRIAGGDLSGSIQARAQDEVGRMVASLQEMQGKLLGVVRQVQVATGTISGAAREISAGNQNLSQRTEEQASSLEETASAMEQMTSTVRQNSDSARHANQLAEGTRDQAEKGGAVVREAIGAMSEVSEQSRKITAIIGVIDEIAFQTNLLALNAAVEAARAGDMGRGFAVVAQEVRNLAQRSAGAAKEIKGLIQDTVAKVEVGSELINRSGATLDVIVRDVKQVSTIVAEIAAASLEQTQGIDEVGKAVMQMDEMTQQNAALVEQAAAAAEEMEGQARTLEEMMTFFKIGGPGAPRVASTPPVVRPAPAARAPVPRAAPAPAKPRLQAQPRPAPATRPAAADSDAGDWEEF